MKLLANIKQFIVFGAVGASGIGIGMSVLNIAMYLHGNFVLANIIAFPIAASWNFMLHSRFTFTSSKQFAWRRWGEFLFGSCGAAVLNWSIAGTLFYGIDFFNNHYNAAALLGIGASCLANFTWSKCVVFSECRALPQTVACDPSS